MVRIRNQLLTVLGATTVIVVLATAASASTTISIKSSQVPVQASAFEEQDDCDFAGQPSQSPPLWGWHFVLPGGTATFVSLTATFATAGDVTLPGSAGAFVQDGKGAVIYTATDDTLTGAVATIDGTTPQGDFVLSHTCLPGVSPTPSVSPSETLSPSPSETLSPSPSESLSVSPSVSVSGTVLTSSPSESVSPTVLGVKQTKGAVGGTTLPTTGASALVMTALAGLLVASGIVLLRRPRGRYAR